MNEKKAYVSPQLFEVPLDQDQAILTACSTATTVGPRRRMAL